MANFYVWSGAAGAATGADWANACLTLAAGITASAAGDDIWVAQDHSESTAAAVTLNFKGTSASPNRIMCVDRAGTVPPVSADLRTTAVCQTTGASNLNVTGIGYIYGIQFKCGSAASLATLSVGVSGGAVTSFILNNCLLELSNTNASSRIVLADLSNAAARLRLIGTSVKFGNASQHIYSGRGRVVWENTANPVDLTTLPTKLLDTSASPTGFLFHVIGVDLSALDVGRTLVGNTNASVSGMYVFQDCKIGASVTVAATPAVAGGTEVLLNACGATSATYRNEKYAYAGTETTETTIVRTGGFSINGTTISKRYVTTANAKAFQPYEAIVMPIANSVTGTDRTVTVYGIWGGGSVPTNADIWFECFYLGTAGNPGASFASCGRADILAAATPHATDNSTWGGSTTAFKMEVVLSAPQPALGGEIYVRVFVGAASTTIYVDPKPVLS